MRKDADGSGSCMEQVKTIEKNKKIQLTTATDYDMFDKVFKTKPKTAVVLPFEKAEVLDLNTRKRFASGRDFEFDVKPGEFGLFYIKAR